MSNILLNQIFNEPFAMSQKDLSVFLNSLEKLDIQALSIKAGSPLDSERKTEVRDGVAIIHIRGTILRYTDWITDALGLSTTESISLEFDKAMTDKHIKGIIFDIDSGGGIASAISELSSMIFNARGMKDIKTYIGGSGASAAYWIGSSAKEIVISDTGIAGSIGAMLTYDDYSKMKEGMGIEEKKFVSNISPNKNAEAELQLMVDRLGEIFVSNVARNRMTTAENVEANFGKGGLFVGKDAVTAGLADKVGTFEEVLQSFQGSSNSLGGGLSAKQSGLSVKQKQIDLLNL